jgi:hypothetical protein
MAETATVVTNLERGDMVDKKRSDVASGARVFCLPGMFALVSGALSEDQAKAVVKFIFCQTWVTSTIISTPQRKVVFKTW